MGSRECLEVSPGPSYGKVGDELMPERKKTGAITQILIALVIALLAGGTAPWWWNELKRLFDTDPASRIGSNGNDDQGALPPNEQTLEIPGTSHKFIVKDGHLISSSNGNPLCPTPPNWRMGCYPIELQYRQNWRNTPDGYMANGKKVKSFTNRSEQIFEILGTKHAFYVDDGHLFYYHTAMILCPWPKAGVAQCHKIEAQYEEQWRNTPEGFIADGQAFNPIEVMRDIRQGLF